MISTVNSEIFARILFSQKFARVKILPSENGKIAQSFTDVRISCPNSEFLMSQICLITVILKLKFSRKFPDLQL